MKKLFNFLVVLGMICMLYSCSSSSDDSSPLTCEQIWDADSKAAPNAVVLFADNDVLPFAVLAQGDGSAASPFDMSEGPVSISESGEYYVKGATTTDANVITVTGSSDTIDVTLHFDNVSIKPATTGTPLKVTNANVTLEIDNEDCALDAKGANNLGISLDNKSSLTINGDASNSEARLEVSGGDSSPAIGGDNFTSITINGSRITAKAGSGDAPAIGVVGDKNTCGPITINGGIIHATASGNATAIGAGQGSASGSETVVDNITINNGTVIASSTQAGIGVASSNSNFASNAHVFINGGNVVDDNSTTPAGNQPQQNQTQSPADVYQVKITMTGIPDASQVLYVDSIGTGLILDNTTPLDYTYGIKDVVTVDSTTAVTVWLPLNTKINGLNMISADGSGVFPYTGTQATVANNTTGAIADAAKGAQIDKPLFTVTVKSPYANSLGADIKAVEVKPGMHAEINLSDNATMPRCYKAASSVEFFTDAACKNAFDNSTALILDNLTLYTKLDQDQSQGSQQQP